LTDRVRPYLFYDTAVSICTVCLRRCEAKIVFEEERVLLDKRCAIHGRERVLLADDVEYYRRCREVFLKAPEMPLRFNTPARWGCPYDCGLCPDHMQHSCLSLIEITDHCNLRCPICYADSGPHRPGYRSVAEVERMLDAVVANEGEPDVVQISGGEPTLHPELFAILDAARRRPIRHLMLNTNGLRLAREPGFAERLAAYQPGFEVYLQLDSLRPGPLRELRGADLVDTRLRALDALDRADLSTTLVVTLKRGVNDDEIGELLDFAVGRPSVRGVTFQPIQAAGRLEGYDPARHRLTLSEVRRRIVEQTEWLTPADVVPVPCNPDCLAMAYALKTGLGPVPLTGLLGDDALLAGRRSTIVFERDESARDRLFRLFATNHSPESQAGTLRDLLCCLPRVGDAPEIGYRDVFRVLILQFVDAQSFDLRAVKKSCVHIAQPDGRLIPFDTFNLFYRDGLSERLSELRAEAIPW
jgi:7,8-dihydro-6-hydroxymethylpterin dimethyltransferase